MFIVSAVSLNTDSRLVELSEPSVHASMAAARAQANKLVRDYLERDPDAEVWSCSMDTSKTVFGKALPVRMKLRIDEIPDQEAGSI